MRRLRGIVYFLYAMAMWTAVERSQELKHLTRRRIPGRRLVNLEARQSVRLDQVITPSATPGSARRSTTASGDRGGFVIANRSRNRDAVCTSRTCLWRARVVIHCWLRAFTDALPKRTVERNDERDKAEERRSNTDAWFCREGALGTDLTRAGYKVDKTCVVPARRRWQMLSPPAPHQD